MRIALGLTAVLLFAILALAIYLVIPVLREPSPVEIDPTFQALAGELRHVPQNATEILLAPRAAATYERLRRHPISRDAIRELEKERNLRLLPWLLGGADVVAWRTEHQSGLVANPEAMRRLLIRLLGEGMEIRDGLVAIGEVGQGLSISHVGWPMAGHFFVLHRGLSGASMPLQRPAITAVTIGDRIEIHSVSIDESKEERPPLPESLNRFPRSAMLAAAFASSPRVIQRIEQTLPVEISPLLRDGGLLVLYRLHDERFLPRPRGLIVLPVSDRAFTQIRRRLESLSPELPFRIAEESRRMVMGQEIIRRETFGFTLEYSRRGDELLIAFDKSSIESYLSDHVTSLDGGQGEVQWMLRFDPGQLVPALAGLRQHAGLRILAPELGRAIEDFYDRVRYLEDAMEVIAVRRTWRGRDELDITIFPPK